MIVLVEAWRDRMGNIYAQPVREDLREQFEELTGDPRAFFQEGDPAEEFLLDLQVIQRRDLREGWTIHFKADLHEVSCWYGYDAQEKIRA